MTGNSGSGGPGRLTPEAYRWALWALGLAPATASDEDDESDDGETR